MISIELRVATGLRRAVTHADSVRSRQQRSPVIASVAVRRRVWQGFGGSVRRSGRRGTSAGRCRGQRRSGRNLLHRPRRQEKGSDLHWMRQFQRGTIVFFDYVNEIFVVSDGNQGLQVSLG